MSSLCYNFCVTVWKLLEGERQSDECEILYFWWFWKHLAVVLFVHSLEETCCTPGHMTQESCKWFYRQSDVLISIITGLSHHLIQSILIFWVAPGFGGKYLFCSSLLKTNYFEILRGGYCVFISKLGVKAQRRFLEVLAFLWNEMQDSAPFCCRQANIFHKFP